jgi:hypothetical protein
MVEQFSKEWWTEILSEDIIYEELNYDNYDWQVVDKVIKGFNLTPFPKGFTGSFTSKNQKASSGLASNINKWIHGNFPHSKVKVEHEKTFNVIRFGSIKRNLNENDDRSQYSDYIIDNLEKIEQTAEYFNFPIDNIKEAFLAGKEVILSDDIWEKLENSKSYKISDLEDTIKSFKKENIDIKPYLDIINNEEELPIPLVFNYGPDEYYLVGGDLILSLYKALNLIPVVLMANIDLEDNTKLKQTTTQLKELDKEKNDKDKKLHELLKLFLKYAVDYLQIQTRPTLILSKDSNKVKENSTFGYFDPNETKIWVYIKNRNTADILRTIAHELIHLKQMEDGRLQPNSGETGSPIENEANALAGVLLRNFGKENKDIYEV